MGPGAAGNPFGAPAAPAADPFGGPPPGPSAAPALPANSPFSFTPAGAPPPSSPEPAADPFANVGGHGSGPAADPFDNLSAANEPASTGAGKDAREWRIKLQDGTVLGPLTLDEVRQKVKAGEITKDAQASQANGAFRIITGFAPLAVVFRLPADSRTPQKVIYRKSDSGGGKWMVLAIVLIGGAAGAGYVFKDKIFAPKEVEYDNIFVRRAQMWRLQFPDVEGTSEEHLAKGLKYFKQDTALNYRLADEEFHKALILDPDNLEAIGAYVENFALLPNRRSDVEAMQDALDGIEFAIKKNPRKARLYRAQGALLVKQGKIEQGQAALAQALRLDPQDAQAKLFMAQTNLDRNVGEAIKLTEEAVRIDPELARSSYILGQAYQRQGRFKTALNQFRSRLSKDKDHKETLLAIARLFVEVGDFQQAEQNLVKVLEVDQHNTAAQLFLARVYYQGLRDFKRAESHLAEAVASLGGEGSELTRDVYTHQAFVLGERGKWKEAEEAIQNALKDDKDYGPALYVAGRVLLHRSAAQEAREKLERALKLIEHPYLEAPVRTLLADTLRQQGQTAEAVRAYSQVMKNDPRYVRAFLGQASLFAAAENMQQAAAVMKEVLGIDPFHRTEHFYFSDYPETTTDIETYRAGWTKVKPGENDKSIVLSSEGITAYHAGQLDEAESLLKRALADDKNSHPASMYLGAVALARRNGREAVKFLEGANRINTLHSRTIYLLGRAYQATDQFDKAEKRFAEVRESDPNFVGAVNALGEMSLRKGEDEKAKELFLDAFKADADFTPAKANLLKTGF